jgi:hypothetical protein
LEYLNPGGSEEKDISKYNKEEIKMEEDREIDMLEKEIVQMKDWLDEKHDSLENKLTKSEAEKNEGCAEGNIRKEKSAVWREKAVDVSMIDSCARNVAQQCLSANAVSQQVAEEIQNDTNTTNNETSKLNKKSKKNKKNKLSRGKPQQQGHFIKETNSALIFDLDF